MPKLVMRLATFLIATSLLVNGCTGNSEVSGCVDKLNSNDFDARLEALQELSKMGFKAHNAVPEVLKALGDNESLIRYNAIRTLEKIASPSEAIPALIKLLDDPEGLVRSRAVVALEVYGSDAAAALPKLLELAENDPWINPENDEYVVRKLARKAISTIDADRT